MEGGEEGGNGDVGKGGGRGGKPKWWSSLPQRFLTDMVANGGSMQKGEIA